MNDSYQVQLDDPTGGWVAVSPVSPHGPCDAVHLGDYWHTAVSDARAHAQKVAAVRSEPKVRIVRKDTDGQITVETEEKP